MNATYIGGIVGAVLAVVALLFGFWGFLLVVVFGGLGALVGAVVSGQLDVRAVAEAARGRRSA